MRTAPRPLSYVYHLLERELQDEAQRARARSAPSISEQSVLSTQSTHSGPTEGDACVQLPDAPAQSTVVSETNPILRIDGIAKRLDSSSVKLQSEADQLK